MRPVFVLAQVAGMDKGHGLTWHHRLAMMHLEAGLDDDGQLNPTVTSPSQAAKVNITKGV